MDRLERTLSVGDAAREGTRDCTRERGCMPANVIGLEEIREMLLLFRDDIRMEWMCKNRIEF